MQQRQFLDIVQAGSGTPVTGESKSDVAEYSAIIRRSKWPIITLSVIGAVAGYLVSLPQPFVYRASSLIEVNEPNDSFLNMRDLQPTVSNMTAESFVQTQLKLLQNKQVIGQARKKLRTAANRTQLRPKEAPERRTFGPVMGKSGENNGDAAVDYAAETVFVRNVPNTRILEVQAESTDPAVAARFVNTLVREFIQYQLETRWDATRRTTDWLQKQIQELRQALQDSESQLQAHAAKSGLLFTSENKGSVAEDKLRQVQQELSAAHSNRVSAEAQYRIATSAPVESLPDVLGDASVRSYALKLSELRGQLIELSGTYTPEHYKIKRLQGQIDELTQTIERERTQISKKIRNEYEAARMRETMLANSYAQQLGMVAGQSAHLVHYNLLKREVDTNRQLYESMLQKVKEAGVASAMRATNVRILSPADPPSIPYKPATGKNILTGLSTGLVLSILLVAVRDKLDRRVREPGEMTFATVPELGVVLSADMKPPARLERRSKSSLSFGSAPALEGVVVGGAPNGRSVELLTWTDKPSIQAESFRSVLISLLAQERERKVFVITSPNPNEGKTTVLSNLAIALADTDRRVLVIDADLREPRLHTIFNVPNNWGLTDLLQERGSLERRAVDSMAKPTYISGLYVLPSGPGAASIFRLLCSSRVDELLRSAAREFDMVLIDTPPMLALPDARILARRTEGAIVVLRAGRTNRDMAQAAVQKFIDDGIPVVGTVLNDWKPSNRDYGTYKRYVYGSH
jgi:polysaccharide biosynthesis transport protein